MAMAVVCACAVLTGACAGADSGTEVRGKALTVYMSAPRHGVSARAGEAAVAGARLALAEAGSRVRGRRIRLVALPSTRPGDEVWHPGTVEANAERAANDPTAIAYIGELGLGGSAVSLPVTNSAGLLQVAPADGLTSLTRSVPGQPRAGPERYYPAGTRNFVRLVPNDVRVAESLLRHAARFDTQGQLVVLHGGGVAEREVAGVLAERSAAAGLGKPLVEPTLAGSVEPDSLASDLARREPKAVIVATVADALADRLIGALQRRLPATPLLVVARPSSPAVLDDGAASGSAAFGGVLAGAAQPERARRLLAELQRGDSRPVPGEATYAYESMRLVLDAARAGGVNRAAVVRAALVPRRRRSPLGVYSVRRDGDVGGLAVAIREPGASPATGRGGR